MKPRIEILVKLKKCDPVKIIDKRYSWFKIVLPETAHLYIKNDYVGIINKKGAGKVNATRVNLRAGPGTKYSILGQVSSPQELQVVSEKDDWYEIKPPEETAGWIHASQVMFNMALVQAGIKEEVKEEASEASPEQGRGIKKTFSKGIMLKRKAPEPKGNLTFSTQSQ